MILHRLIVVRSLREGRVFKINAILHPLGPSVSLLRIVRHSIWKILQRMSIAVATVAAGTQVSCWQMMHIGHWIHGSKNLVFLLKLLVEKILL